ncbi:g-protein coupled receptor [Holotrichia oblita]|uniref:G-protein coupled receptor n=1 Tax=Holotrichia oblita TaxID=644536 RepID=A0ACB9T4Y3_HOLOL|nr:g-protein coupled receptor [Holotrichia oblita]
MVIAFFICWMPLQVFRIIYYYHSMTIPATKLDSVANYAKTLCGFLIFRIYWLLGNISVCVVILKTKKLQTATNYYLFSLAVADLLIIIFSLIPWTMKTLLEKDILKGYICVVKKVASKTGYFAALLTIIAFSVERYIAVCHPFMTYQISQLSKTVKVIIAFWIVAFCLALPKAFYTPCFGNIDGFEPVIDAYKIHLELLLFVTYILSMTIIIILYTLIGFRLKRAKKIASTNSIDQNKIIKMLVAVVVALLICWTPTRIYRFYIFYLKVDKEKIEIEKDVVNYYFRKITRALYYFVSTTINPILYNIMSKNFREGFKKTFFCWKLDDSAVNSGDTEEESVRSTGFFKKSLKNLLGD